MARYGKQHKEATRRRIIEAAGQRLKRDGIDGSGVSVLMADARLTTLMCNNNRTVAPTVSTNFANTQ